MARPITRTQALENRAFLRILARTGNVRDAARSVGRTHSTMFHRRKQHPGLAQKWDAAVAVADARLHQAGGRKGPVAAQGSLGEAAPRSATPPGDRLKPLPNRTAGGEPMVVRRRDGKLQVRRAHSNKITKEGEQAFLSALSATANVALSAAAAGASTAAFHRRRRTNPAFAREMQMALEQGYEALQWALLEGLGPDSYADDAWRNNAAPATPPLSFDQMLQLLFLHQKAVVMGAMPTIMRRRAHETTPGWQARMNLLGEVQRQRERDRFQIAEADRRARAVPSSLEPVGTLPDLAQVTGWSRASGKPPHHEGVPMFGGWRIEDMEKARKGRS